MTNWYRTADAVTEHVMRTVAERMIRRKMFLSRRATPNPQEVSHVVERVMKRINDQYGNVEKARLAAGIDHVSTVVEQAVAATRF